MPQVEQSHDPEDQDLAPVDRTTGGDTILVYAGDPAEHKVTPALPTSAPDDLACADPGRVLVAERDDHPIDLDLIGSVCWWCAARTPRGPPARPW